MVKRIVEWYKRNVLFASVMAFSVAYLVGVAIGAATR